MSLTRNALLAVVQVVVVGLVYFVLYRILHQTIGPAGLGVFSVVLATTSVGRMSSLGLAGSVVKFVARDLARGDPEAAARTLDAARLGNGVFMGGIVLLVWPIAWLLLPALLEPQWLDRGRAILPEALGSLWLVSQAGVFQAAVEARERFDLRAGLVITSSLGYLALSAALVGPWGLTGLALAQVGQSATLYLGMFVAARRGMPIRLIPRRLDRVLFKELLSFGLRFQAMTLGTLLFEPLAKALASRFGGAVFSGYFEMANRMVTQLRQLISAATQALVPAAAKAMETDPAQVDVLLRTSTNASMFLVFPALAATLVLAPAIGELWIGHRVPLFEHLAWILAIGSYANLLAGPAWFVNLGTGNLAGNTRATAAMLAITAALPWPLRPWLGGYGVALAYSLAFLIGGVMIIADSQRGRGRTLREAFDPRSFTLAIASLVGAAAALSVIPWLRDYGRLIAHGSAVIILAAVIIVPLWRHPMTARLIERALGSLGTLSGPDTLSAIEGAPMGRLSIFTSPRFDRAFKALLALWAVLIGVLIWRSSFIGSDGARHFALFDDGMIAMRYAYNLATGNGLVFNVGERVEGFTSPLMVFVMAGAIVVFGKYGAILATQVLGALLLGANLYFVTKITRHVLADRCTDLLLAIPLMLTMGWYPITYWSITGMDTGLLTTIVLAAVWVGLTRRSFGASLTIGVLLGLAYLTRPESALFMAALLLYRAIHEERTRRGLARMALEVALCAIPIVAYQLFRMRYYGQSVPNTYILKATGMPLGIRIRNGLGYCLPFLARMAPLLVVALLFLWSRLRGKDGTLGTRTRDLLVGSGSIVALFIFTFALYAAYQVWASGDPWPPFWRMPVPYTVLLFIAVPAMALHLRTAWGTTEPRFHAALAGLTLLTLAAIPLDYHWDIRNLRPSGTVDNQGNVNQALLIDRLTTPDATVTSLWAGTIPYYTERTTLDPLGKVDAYIARLAPDISGAMRSHGMISLPGHNKYDLHYTLELKQPDVIVYLAYKGRYCAWGSQDLQDWCDAHYDLVDEGGVKLLLKKGSPHIVRSNVAALATTSR